VPRGPRDLRADLRRELTSRASIAPALALETVGVSPAEFLAHTTTPAQPRKDAERSNAPRFCGSITCTQSALSVRAQRAHRRGPRGPALQRLRAGATSSRTSQTGPRLPAGGAGGGSSALTGTNSRGSAKRTSLRARALGRTCAEPGGRCGPALRGAAP
jgi:hypothetical protein